MRPLSVSSRMGAQTIDRGRLSAHDERCAGRGKVYYSARYLSYGCYRQWSRDIDLCSAAPTPHFRTIQICLNDPPGRLWQAEGARTWLRRLLVVTPDGRPHVRHEAAAVHHADRQRGVPVARAWAAAEPSAAGRNISADLAIPIQNPALASRRSKNDYRISSGRMAPISFSESVRLPAVRPALRCECI
jgi:hypothetical protein